MVSKQSKWPLPLFISALAILVTISVTMIYVDRVLQGEFRHIFLPAQMFGVPEKLAAHGYDTLFKDEHTTGWDGQFYYYIANDPFARADTPAHLDADAYRYQRIGLPLLAFAAAKLTGQHWVSPQTYYLTNLAILFVATFMTACFFRRHDIHPLWVLLWTLGMGTQMTQMHGLPDGAADGLLLIALICLLNGRTLPYVIAMAFAALSREIYALVPAAMLAGSFILSSREHGLAPQLRPAALCRRLRQQWMHILPVAIVVAWQIFVRLRFHIAPSAQTFDIIGLPLKSALQFMLAPWTGMRPLDAMSMRESLGILLMLSLMLVTAWRSAQAAHRHLRDSRTRPATDPARLGIAIALLLIVATYLCFGSTVMSAASNYWKAGNAFLLMLPFIAAIEGRRFDTGTKLLSVAAFVLFSVNLVDRLSQEPFIEIARIDYAQTEPACLTQFSAQVRPLSVQSFPDRWWQRITGNPIVLLDVEVVNSGQENLDPFRGKGTVAAGYQWIDPVSGHVLIDGRRVPLRRRLLPGQSAQLPLQVEFPEKPGRYILRLTLVQEGCDWFYNRNADSKFDIGFTIR